MKQLALALLVASTAGLSTHHASASPAPSAAASVEARDDGKITEMKARAIIYERVKVLVAARDFAGLDAIEHDYRTSRSRTGSGSWKLAEFHIGVELALPRAKREIGCPFAAEPFLNDWARADPAAPAPYIAKATMLVNRAWCFRGDGYASEVPENVWQLFRDDIDQAEALLTEHKAVAAIDPEYYAVMEIIFRAQSRSDGAFHALVDEATKREPYYYPIYWHTYTHAMPQWGGSSAAIERAARYEVSRTRKADGLGAYARFYWFAIVQDCDCWTDAIDLPTMKLGMRDLADRYPDPWNLAHFARFACMFNDRETARTYFDKLGKEDVVEAWDSPESYQQCRAFAGA